MALGPSRFNRIGESPYAHEIEGVELVREALPNNDPYHAWALFELPDPKTGRLLEVDVLVMGYGGLYLLELKAHPGRISGDATDWYWQPPDANGRKVWMDPPYRLANLKAKVLKSRLRSVVKDDRLLPYIQALVFLSHEDAMPDLRADGRIGVVTRGELRDALLKHQFPGAPSSWQNRRVSAPQVQAVARALEKLGIRKREGKLLVGEYELKDLVDDGPGFQDRRAVHRANEKAKARARTYLVPAQTSVERRQQLRRAADRESALLYDVREHPQVLSWLGYVPDAPLGPTVLFDAFEGGQPLPSFLRTQEVSFQDRLDVVEQVARALAYCHRRQVVHGGLTPDAVLVRRAGGALEVRLTSFQLGSGRDVESTSHWSQLASDPSFLYQAPELREGAHRDARSDVYGLGALAYYLFSGGRHPADDVLELHRLQLEQGHLDVRVVAEDVPAAVADAIDFATQTSLAARADDAEEWLQLLLQELTEPDAAPDAETDPLQAKKGDLLGDLLVDRELGQGASARVIQVLRESDNRELALKVSLEPEHDPRLKAEAEVLGRLRHPRIVPLHEVREIGGRTCLLLGLAGSHTLHRYLAEEGTVSLDFASRYGDDLLSALEHLEDPDVQITHRDIKPANLGVGTAGKKAHHLTLFDFSLAHVPRSQVAVGTSAYRDPFLPSRGAWDAAADRWSAAVTLHEMLTSVRPRYHGALDPQAKLDLAAERFDASVRGALVGFFEKALHRDVERRFASAKEMRHAWFRIFERPAEQTPGSAPASAAPPAAEAPLPDEPLTDDEVRAIAPDTPVMALPLSFRARNALDRAGLLTANDLLTLPENRLSAVRGVGTKVAREILQFRERWATLGGHGAAASTPFAPDYAGDDVLVTSVGLDEALAHALTDAGLRTLGGLARAPEAHVRALAERAGGAADDLRALLARETAQANERGLPQSIEALLEELLPKKKKRARYVEALFGLAEPFAGRLDVIGAEVARHFGTSPANVYNAVSALREAWEAHGALGELEDRASVVLDAAGGALPLSRAADALRAKLPHDEASPVAQARAAALLRVVAEVQKQDVDGVRAVRLGRGAPWFLAHGDHAQHLRRLGKAADALADREVLASPGETQRQLERVARATPFEPLSAAQLAELSAAASDRAACSALMEIYPRGMAAERALELSAQLLASAARAKPRTGEAGLSPEDVRRKVAARYPEAAPLPGRPALDGLMAELKLDWDEASGRYRPPGEAGVTSSASTSYASRHLPTFSVHPRPDTANLSQADVERADFERSLRVAVEQRAFRALGVNPAYAFEAEADLGRALGVTPQPLDALLLAAMKGVMADKNIRPAVVHAADREGPGGPAWGRLLQLMRLAERRVLADLTAQPGPHLLTRPGLLARYRLTALLEGLVARVQDDDAEAIFLLVPCHDYGGAPQINDRHPIPGILSVHAQRVPRAFVRLDDAAA